MKFATTFATLAAVAGYASAQAASAADVAIVRQQLVNVVAAVTELGNGVTAFQTQADTPSLLSQSAAVIASLNDGATAIQPVVGFIDVVTASSQLLDQVQALNAVVDSTVTAAINKKQVFVDACGGPTLLDQLQQQLTAARSLIAVILTKFEAANQGLVTNLSQPSLDSLQRAIDAFSDQTSLPASCSGTPSSAPAEPSSTPAPAPSSSAAAEPSSAPAQPSSAAVEPSSVPVEPPASSQPVQPPASSEPGSCGPPSSFVTSVMPPTSAPAVVTSNPPASSGGYQTSVAAPSTTKPPSGECPPAGTVTVTVTVTKDGNSKPTKKPWENGWGYNGGNNGGYKPWENKNYRVRV